jgi:hypothetical protein
MHQARLTIGFALLLLGCDPVVSNTLRLTPSPVAVADSVTVQAGATRADALAAVERLALTYGLQPQSEFPKRCTREWRSGPTGQYRLRLYMCAVVPPGGGLDVQLSEYITDRWSPKGDSLRRALADTLARFGSVSSP